MDKHQKSDGYMVAFRVSGDEAEDFEFLKAVHGSTSKALRVAIRNQVKTFRADPKLVAAYELIRGNEEG